MNGDDGRTGASFMRGLTIGAIIGAIIAGSSIWSRRHRRQSASSAEPSATAKPD